MTKSIKHNPHTGGGKVKVDLAESSTVKFAHYSPSTRELTVRFHSGRTYNYTNVHPRTITEWQKSDSPGAYFHRTIKTNEDIKYQELNPKQRLKPTLKED